MLPTKFQFIWPNGFREDFLFWLLYRLSGFRWEDLLQIDKPETRSAYGSLLTDWNEMSNCNRGTSIDAFYQVPVHLAKWFKTRSLKCEKLTDDRRRTQSDDKSSHCLCQSESKMMSSTDPTKYPGGELRLNYKDQGQYLSDIGNLRPLWLSCLRLLV